MNRDVLVGSSSVATMGYDEANEALEIEFTSGHVYQYVGVPADVWQELQDAPSKGHYIRVAITGNYEAQHIS